MQIGAPKRNTAPMLESLRCGAKTRAGGTCRAPAVRGKRRCRMHGGAKGSGAPQENQNALKHGSYTRAAFQERALIRELLRRTETMLTEAGLVRNQSNEA
jgi:hypothetical protein